MTEINDSDVSTILKEVLASMRRQEHMLSEIAETGKWFRRQTERQQGAIAGLGKNLPRF